MQVAFKLKASGFAANFLALPSSISGASSTHEYNEAKFNAGNKITYFKMKIIK